MPCDVWNEITYPIPNFNDGTIEDMELKSNFIPLFMINVTTYPYWDYS